MVEDSDQSHPGGMPLDSFELVEHLRAALDFLAEDLGDPAQSDRLRRSYVGEWVAEHSRLLSRTVAIENYEAGVSQSAMARTLGLTRNAIHLRFRMSQDIGRGWWDVDIDGRGIS